MLRRIAERLVTILLRESANLRLWLYKRLYPGLGIDPSARINRQGGVLVYGTNVNILEQAVIELPHGTCVRLGSNTFVARSCMLHPSGGQEIVLGEFATLQERGLLIGNIKVGRYSIIAPNFYASSGNHFFDIIPQMNIRDQDALVFSDSRYEHLRSGKLIEIEEDCWIGINVSVMSGVKIGKGSVIGANSVVTKDIPPYSIAVGSPAKVIKQRLAFEPPSRLDWTEIQYRPYFYSGFCVDNIALQKYASGIAGYADCIICLAAPEKPSLLCIEAIPILSEISIVFGETQLPMKDGISIYCFTISEHSGNTYFPLKIHRSSLPIRAEEPTFLLRRVWFELL